MNEPTVNRIAPAGLFIMMHERPWAGPNAFLIKGQETSLGRGRRLEVDPGEFVFELRVDPQTENPMAFPPLDFHYPPPALPIFSGRLREVLASVGVDNIDYYPTTVVYQPTGAQLDYKVGNVIGVVEGLDRARSTFVADEEGFVEDISKIFLDEDKFQGKHLVRLYEALDLLVISRRLKDAIVAAKLTGIQIVTDDEWEPGMI